MSLATVTRPDGDQAMDPAVPFGRPKMRGDGRESGRQHPDEYLNVTAVWIKAA